MSSRANAGVFEKCFSLSIWWHSRQEWSISGPQRQQRGCQHGRLGHSWGSGTTQQGKTMAWAHTNQLGRGGSDYVRAGNSPSPALQAKLVLPSWKECLKCSWLLAQRFHIWKLPLLGSSISTQGCALQWLEVVKNCKHCKHILMELAKSSVDVLTMDNCSPQRECSSKGKPLRVTFKSKQNNLKVTK